MEFERAQPVDTAAVLRMLGYSQAPPDAGTAERLERAVSQVQQAAQPRWVCAYFPLLPGPRLSGPGLLLPGGDIAAHLDGCAGCLLLGVTLGAAVERVTRAAEASDMALAVLLDACASVLAESYADEAENLLRAQQRAEGRFLTSRFSPGYGDLPISLQRELVRLLDAPRAIGLTVSASGILLPRKSITALLGVSGHPVHGRLAGCGNCALRHRCQRGKDGKKLCGTF